MDTCIFSISAVQRRKPSPALALVFAAIAALVLVLSSSTAPPLEAPAASWRAPTAHVVEPCEPCSVAAHAILVLPLAPRRRARSSSRPSTARPRTMRPRMRCRPGRSRSGCTVSRAASALLRAHQMIRPKIARIRIANPRAHDSGISVECVRRAMFEKSARALFYPDADIATERALLIVFPSTVNDAGALPTPLGAALGSALSPIGEV